MACRDDGVATIVAFAGKKKNGARVTCAQKPDARSGHSRTGPLHEFGAGHASSDGLLVELADLHGGDRLHEGDFNGITAQKQRTAISFVYTHARASFGSPNGDRTRVPRLRIWCPRPLDDGATQIQ